MSASPSPSSSPPPGFSLCENIIPEESWNEIKSFLGLQLDQPNLGMDVPPVFGARRRQLPTEENNTSTCIPWELTPPPQNRPVAQFGFRYDYQTDHVIGPAGQEQEGVAVPHIPSIFQRLLLDPLQRQGGPRHDDPTSISSQHETFDQCIVNVYYPRRTKSITPHDVPPSNENAGSHIPWHVDDSQFGPTILVYTFGEARPLHMRNIPKTNDATTTKRLDETTTLNQKQQQQQGYYFSAHPPHGSYYVLSGDARHLWEHSVPSGSDWRVSITFRTLRGGADST